MIFYLKKRQMASELNITDPKFQALRTEAGAIRSSLTASQKLYMEKLTALAVTQGKLEKELSSSRDQSRIAQYSKDLKAIEAEADALKTSLDGMQANLGVKITDLLLELDPRAQVSRLDDQYPVLLLPMRVETRFVTVKHIARVQPEKLANAPARDFILDSQSGRKAKSYQVSELYGTYTQLPVIEDLQELWIRIFPDDIAIHTHEEALTPEEIEAAKVFWTHIWYAGGDESLEIGAWRGLISGLNPERAAWIANQMRPSNHADRPSAPIDPASPLPVEPIFPAPAQKPDSWTQTPHSKVMPDRVIVRLYSASGFREVVGNPIPDPLPVSFNPLDPATGLDNADGKLVLPENIRWVQDFEEAEKVGMAIRVPLSVAEQRNGFRRMLVLGVKASSDENKSKELLEGLIENHHYTAGGFSILPQGTPTNNTEDSTSGYTPDNSDDEYLFELELGDGEFAETSADSSKKDGQHLAEALGIDYDAVKRIRHAGMTDIQEAQCMNRALWPTTLGYYLSQIMHPIFTKGDIQKTRSHFNKYVLGRGRIPAIRVDEQPYGILPTTAFSRWNYQGTDSNSRFLSNMHSNVLVKMEDTWQQLSSLVKHADQTFSAATTDQAFLEIVGLHASSVEYYQRYVSGPFFIWNLYAYGQLLQNQAIPSGLKTAAYATSLDFLNLFQNLNYIFAYPPRVFDFIHARKEKYLNGAAVDPFPLSETRGLKVLGSNGENYIDWLEKSDFYTIKAENFSNIGASGAIPPNSLLYLMLRHSCLLEYVHTGINVLVSQGILSDIAHLDTELVNVGSGNALSPAFQELVRARVLLQENTALNSTLDLEVDGIFSKRASEGDLAGLNFKEIDIQKRGMKENLKKESQPDFLAKVEGVVETELQGLKVTASKTALLGDQFEFLQGETSLAAWIDKNLSGVNEDLLEMADLKSALSCLSGLPTARLERLFAEHVDLASYRLDAWFTALVSERLDKLRNTGSARQTGIFLGGYSWLENVRPGSFPGIAYREVEIAPDRIRIPGIREATLQGINLPGPVESAPLPGLGLLSVAENVNRTASVQPNARTADSGASPSILEMADINVFAKGDLLQESKLIATGNIGMVLDEAKTSILVDAPLLYDLPTPVLNGPSYTYLGSGSPGNIIYDAILDKFVPGPRVDISNQGYIHAPSVNQAMTAAVLRSGYESHKRNPGSPDDTFAVNLSSERVRRAMYFLEGIRNGQELAGLLGYQFERALHDRNENLDEYILDIRLKYPLVSNRVTTVGGASNVKDIEANNVVDGLKLMDAYRVNSPLWYGGITFVSVQLRLNIEQEIERLMDSMDAVHDLLLAESVHQVVQGNDSRSRAALNALSGNAVPPEPELIRTPREFKAVTMRTGLVFEQGAAGTSAWTTGGTPRSIAEPGLNGLIARFLPASDKIAISVRFRRLFGDGSPGSEDNEKVMAEDLGLEAIDFFSLLAIAKDEGESAELNARVAQALQSAHPEVGVEVISIEYTNRTSFLADERTIQEIGPLLSALRRLVEDSKVLNPRDFLLSSNAESTVEANPGGGFDLVELEGRLDDVLSVLMGNGDPGLAGVLAGLQASLTALSDNLSGGLLGLDLSLVDGLSAAMLSASRFGVQGSIPEVGGNLSEADLTELLAQGGRVADILQQRLDDANELLAEVPGLSSQDQKLAKLQETAKAIFGRSFRLFPKFLLYDVAAFDAARNYPDYLASAGEMAIEEWIQGLSPLRKRMRSFRRAEMVSAALKGSQPSLPRSIVQMPLAPLGPGGDVEARWLGTKLPEGYEIPDENLSMVLSFPPAYDSALAQAGLVVDEWVEEIPIPDAHTGLSVHYNNPNSEPPNACLLAVSPDLNGSWEWDHLMETLYETLDWAKKRAVDPDLLNDTPYAQLLPAIMAAIAGTDDTPTLDFGRNVVQKPKHGIFDMIKLKEFQSLANEFKFSL